VNCTQYCFCYLNWEWRHSFLHSKALCRSIAKSVYTEQNYYNTATQHENSKSSNSELLFELWHFCISINYSSSISRLLAHNAWHSVQQSLACGGPFLVGPLFGRTCWTMPKSYSEMFWLKMYRTPEFNMGWIQPWIGLDWIGRDDYDPVFLSVIIAVEADRKRIFLFRPKIKSNEKAI